MHLPFGKWVKDISTQVDHIGWTELGDFTTNKRVFFLALAAIAIGALARL